MTSSRAFELAALLLATFTAWHLVPRVPHHRPVARALALLLAIDVARLATHGATGALWCLDVGLVAGWYVVTAGLVVGVLGRRWAAVGVVGFWGWCAACSLTIGAKIGGAPVVDVWRALYLVALALQLAAALYLVRAARARRWPGVPETVALLVAAGSLADLAGPWLRADVVRAWPSEQWQSAATWGIVAAWQAWRRRRT